MTSPDTSSSSCQTRSARERPDPRRRERPMPLDATESTCRGGTSPMRSRLPGPVTRRTHEWRACRAACSLRGAGSGGVASHCDRPWNWRVRRARSVRGPPRNACTSERRVADPIAGVSGVPGALKSRNLACPSPLIQIRSSVSIGSDPSRRLLSISRDRSMSQCFTWVHDRDGATTDTKGTPSSAS